MRSTTLNPGAYTVIDRDTWRSREATHIQRAEQLTAGYVDRRSRGLEHPVEDFLFTYYNLKPSGLKRWHPGAGIVLQDAAPSNGEVGAGKVSQKSPPRHAWRDYKVADGGGLFVDSQSFLGRRGATVRYIADLFAKTMTRPPSLGCFGLHEWAMVYRMSPEELRHSKLPLRLAQSETDGVVDSHQIACTHYDAFRFFTPEAAPLNNAKLTRESQPDLEQPGCLHAGMDVYKWTMKLGPLAPGELLLDSFALAKEIRQLDMQASPYDVTSLGLEAVPIETPDGKSEYARRQREFMHRGNELRVRVLDAIEIALAQG